MQLKGIDFDKWLSKLGVDALESLTTSILNNQKTGNITVYTKPYINAFDEYTSLQASDNINNNNKKNKNNNSDNNNE